ncbi:MAG: transglutaminase domain-containing protein [Acidobacteria bacterium]|nr:transglutaminase domain-containing protein [Acidobacteriota bacterium]
MPRAVARPLSALIVLAWLVQMGVLLHRTVATGVSAATLAADIGRYGAGAQWKGVYYKGHKIGFMVGQTVPTDDGYLLQEEGQLQMTLFGSSTAARLKTSVQVDREFMPRSFSFSLDPGTGPIEVDGRLDGRTLHLTIRTSSGTRTEAREIPETPLLALNLPRRLAAEGLAPGKRFTVSAFDPATLRNAPMTVVVEGREVVWAAGRPVPAFRVQTEFSGITSSSWVTDVGEVVKEESPMGLVVLRETRDQATALAVPGDVRGDMLRAAAVVPEPPRRIDDPASVTLLRFRLEGGDFAEADLQGAGQRVSGGEFEIVSPRSLAAGPADPEAARFLAPEPLIESDAPEIAEEGRRAAAGASSHRLAAERLTRHVAALLEKRPTVSLPSAREVLRTRIGDCNEHTALYVALARSLGIPARVAVGLVYVQGAFYYHAWPEVYLAGPAGRGLWLPVDPTLNQFPADATHVRLIRGGLDRQAALVQSIGRLKMKELHVELRPGSVPILVGRAPANAPQPLELTLPRRDGGGRWCWSQPD